MRFTTLFFDLDDTLYPAGNGLWEAIRDRMGLYMNERLGIPSTKIPGLRQSYYETYGTTLRGLQQNFMVDAGDFLAYVHDLPLSTYLKPDPQLRRLLLSLPQRRFVLTNADFAHASRVLAQLGVSDCFEGIVDIVAVNYACKPEPEAYRGALSLAGESQARRCVFFDDSTRNLAPAHRLGFYTVLVGSAQPHPAASLSITSLSDLPQAFPQLWTEDGR